VKKILPKRKEKKKKQKRKELFVCFLYALVADEKEQESVDDVLLMWHIQILDQHKACFNIKHSHN
jgi:hypothetical protein